MSLYHPRSIVSLILVGFAVVLTPPVIAVVTAFVQVDRFASDSRSAVLLAGSAAESSSALVDQVTAMQRALGQYNVRADQDFLDIYQNRRGEFLDALASLMALESGVDVAALQALQADEARVYERVIEGEAAAGDWQAAVDTLSSIADRSLDVLIESEQLVEANADDLNERADSLQRTLLILAAAAAPATVVLAVFFTFLITRPMRELGGAIRLLGARSLDQPIVVKGPRDIEALADDLEWLRRRISSLEDQKATFLQHISHELKTPLTTIREGSELLSESLDEEHSEEREIARLLRENGLYLQQLIEDLLQFAKTQELAIDLEFEPAVQLAELVEACIAGQSVVIDSKSARVETRLENVSVRCDGAKVSTVLNNLLSNAIKYTPDSGQVTIELKTVREYAQIDVRDTGPGVAESEQARIFEPFKQGSAKYDSSVKGTGLGLSIAREYVVAHGGSIELLPSEQGAHFRVLLPIAGPGHSPD